MAGSSDIRNLGDRTMPLPTDVTKSNQVESMMSAILKGLNFFVANAGKYAGGDLVDSRPKVLDENFNGAVRVVLAYLKRKKSGYFIFVSLRGWRRCGLLWFQGLWENFAQSLSRAGLFFWLVVSPDPVDGRTAEQNWTAEKHEREKGSFLLPSDVARSVLFRASTCSNFCPGWEKRQ